MDLKTFNTQLIRLKQAYNWTPPTGMDAAWYRELKERNYAPEDFKTGISACIFHLTRFPSLAEVDKYCGEARRERRTAEHNTIVKQPITDALELPASGNTGKTHLAKWRDLYSGRITIAEFVAWMKSIGEHGGAETVARQHGVLDK
jgi:hypothetical protein